MQGRDNKWRLSFWEKTFIFAIVHGFCKANVDIALKSRAYSVEFVAGYFLSVYLPKQEQEVISRCYYHFDLKPTVVTINIMLLYGVKRKHI